ncbi:MAG TPA: G1 family glutamic endopeptidase [Actinomycetota bacterium]|jgi:hypothetical protein
MAVGSTTLLMLAMLTGVAAAAPKHLAPIRIIHMNKGAVTSGNWSGYASTGTTFKSVKGTWTQPSIDCSVAPNGAVAFWVGLDGFTSGTVEQDGTIAFCTNGTAKYFDWWEMYPANAVQVVHTINPGDKFTSSVQFTGGQYILKVTDTTNSAASFSTTQSCQGTCSRSSAEWITEAPCCVGSGFFPLPNFNSIKFTSAATANDAGHKGPINDPSWTATSITMVNGSGQTKVSTSALNAAGNSFTNRWVRAS